MILMTEDAKLKYLIRMIRMDKIYLVGNNNTGDVKAHTTEELDALAKVILSDLNMTDDNAPISGEPHSYDYFFNERIINMVDYITLVGYYKDSQSELIQF